MGFRGFVVFVNFSSDVKVNIVDFAQIPDYTDCNGSPILTTKERFFYGCQI